MPVNGSYIHLAHKNQECNVDYLRRFRVAVLQNVR